MTSYKDTAISREFVFDEGDMTVFVLVTIPSYADIAQATLLNLKEDKNPWDGILSYNLRKTEVIIRVVTEQQDGDFNSMGLGVARAVLKEDYVEAINSFVGSN